VLRKRLLRSDGAMDLAREASAAATSAVDKAVDEIAEAQAHTSAAERELAACRLAIAEVQQALQRVEQEHKKEKREMALQRVRAAAALAASAAIDKKSSAERTAAAATAAARAAGPGQGVDSGGEVVHAAADIGGGVRRALTHFKQEMNSGHGTGAGSSGDGDANLGVALDLLALARRDDGSVDFSLPQVQQAFTESLNAALARQQSGHNTTGHTRSATGEPPSSHVAEISAVDFTSEGELSRVSFDLRFNNTSGDGGGSAGSAGIHECE
jgi:hypothetical protein